MKKIYVFVAAFMLSMGAFAQAPEKMSYQAVIRDANQSLVSNQSVGMQVSILKGSASGAVVYQETQTPSTNENGLVSMQIGSGTVISGDFSTIDWSSDIYFIKTETDPTGGTTYTISGTSQMLSVPYALYAKTSGNGAGPQGPAGADGLSAYQLWLNEGNTGTESDFLNSLVGATGPQGPAGNDGADGATGPMGPQGPAGNDGADGATGPMGPQGPAGNDGADGATGPMGPQGPAGNDGADGATGPMGPQGPAGNDGADGATGPMGPQGPAGNDGADGATGPMGPQGSAGNDGADGATGPMGPQGPAGNDGADGATGPMGPQGPAGNDGADGATGPQGPAGNDGADGATGPQGPQGPAGPIAGSDKQINFNDGGNAGADAELVYDKTSNHMAIGTATINPSAALEVNSTTGAVLFPRMTSAQRDALTGEDGMVVFNTTARKLQLFLSGGTYSEGNSVGVSFGYSDNTQGNTFQIANTAYVNTISVSIANPSGNPITGTTVYTMKIYDSQGGSLLATSSNTFSATPGGYTGGAFDFSSANLLLSGNTSYYFEVTSDNGSNFYLYASYSNNYTLGAMYVNGAFNATADIRFTITSGTADEWVDLH